MGDSLVLYRTLMTLLCQHLRRDKGPHLGQLKTLAWCIVGLLLVGKVNLPQWASQIVSHARQQASRERRLYRWLNNAKVVPLHLYGPLIREALHRWGPRRLYLALDTTTLWNRFTMVYVSVIYRGRAIPLAWRVIRSQSTAVGFASYQPILREAAQVLPADAKVVLLADRGFADVALMRLARDLGWSFRIRIKGNFWVSRGNRACPISRLCPKRGEARFYHNVFITKQGFGPVHLALAWCDLAGQTAPWYVVSDEVTDLTTFDDYSYRFDTEELFLDEKSANFQILASELDQPMQLSRLALVLAITILALTAWGTAACALQLRRTLDGHWLRGLSYLRIGWNFVRRCLALRQPLPTWLHLDSAEDPEPASPSLRQALQPGLKFRVCFDP